ncbi:MAG: hypothetical protein ACO3TX_06765 [Pseudomonadales bacterium]
MAFMKIAAGGGDFVPYVKYNAKAGRWYTKNNDIDSVEVEVANMTAIFDMDGLRTGWFDFRPGQAPSKVFNPSLTESAPQPDGHKAGFQLNVFSDKNLFGEREFCSTAIMVCEAMNTLHTEWEAQRSQHPGESPVVSCKSVRPVAGQHGTNYAPALEIVGWAKWPGNPSAAPQTTPQAPAAPPAAHAPPPVDNNDVYF